MTAAAHGQVPPAGPRESDRGGHVISGADLRYYPWPPVNLTIPYALGADGVVVIVISCHDPAGEVATE